MNSKELENLATAVFSIEPDPEPNVEIAKIVDETQLNDQDKIVVHKAFDTIVAEIGKWKDKALSINVTSIEQKEDLKEAHSIRMTLRDMRLAAKRKTDTLLEESKKYIKGVNSAYKFIEGEVKPLEEHLQAQEDFEKEYKEKMRAELREQRLALVAQFPLGNIPMTKPIEDYKDIEFTKMLEGMEIVHNQQVAEAKIKEQANSRMQLMLSKGVFRLLSADVDIKYLTEQMPESEFNIEVAKLLEIEQQRIEEDRQRAERERLAKEEESRRQAEVNKALADEAEAKNRELLKLQQENQQLRQVTVEESQAKIEGMIGKSIEAAQQSEMPAEIANIIDSIAEAEKPSNLIPALEDETNLKSVADKLIELRNIVYTSEKWKEFGKTINNQIDIIVMNIKSKV